jgi:SAM-dependent methyltransferase
MAYLLFPGRHLLNTKFQETYLRDILSRSAGELQLVGNSKVPASEKINEIIFSITSSNQSNSRYNPVPFWARTISIDRFAQEFKSEFGVRYRIIGIPHYAPSSRYVDILLKEVEEATSDHISLTPENTIVLCSTPALIDAYLKAGFAVLPAEYSPADKKFNTDAPIDIIKKVFTGSVPWNESPEFTSLVSPSSQAVWKDFPDIPAEIAKIWSDPLLTESGSLTSERNYSTYALGMGSNSLIHLKYDDIKEAIIPGKIADEGCADGALMVLLAKDFPDSDILGIEITSEFMARCLERQRTGEFGGTFVHFHQKNLFDRIFKDNSIDATICNSTTHELWSYGSGEASLRDYLKKKFSQLRPGGRLIIRDVVGPENKEQEVWLRANTTDGSNEEIFKEFDSPTELSHHINGLSTHARFKRFAKEFLEDMRTAGKRGQESVVQYKEETLDDVPYFILSLKDAVEFMSRKDYTDNWKSELNEEFAFMSFSEWKKFVSLLGFQIVENPNEPAQSSRIYTNPWIVENRYEGKTNLFTMKNGSLEPLPYPVTNMVLIAQKPDRF